LKKSLLRFLALSCLLWASQLKAQVPHSNLDTLKIHKNRFETNNKLDAFNNLIINFQIALLNWNLPLEEANFYSDYLLEKVENHPHLDSVKTRVYEALGYFHGLQGNTALANEFFDKSKALALLRADSLEWIRSHIAQSRMYQFRHENETVASILESIVPKIPRNLCVDEIYSNVYTLLGMTLIKLNQYEKAKIYFTKALECATKAGDQVWIGLSCGNLGSLYIRLKYYDSALVLLAQDVKISKEFGLDISVSKSYQNMAEIYLTQKKIEQAKVMLDSALKYCLPHKLELPTLKMIYSSYAKLFEQTHDFEKAFYYQKLIGSVSDSISKLKSQKSLDELKTRYEYLVAQKEIDLLKKNNNLNNIYLIASCLSALVLAVILIMVLREKKILNKKNTLIEAQAQDLALLNAQKDKLFSIIGHDLRGPIANIKSLLTLQNLNSLSPEEYSYFSNLLQKDVSSLHDMLENLLNWARSQMHGNQMNWKTFAISEVVDSVLELYRGLAASKNIDLIQNVKSDSFIYADQDQMHLILRNLVANAIKFTNPGGQVRIVSQQTEHQLQLEISDSGIGMEPETIEKIISGRYLSSQKGTQNEKGTGLGLMLCIEMVTANKGSFEIESQIRKGTKIKLTFPKQ
jgi:signal transduction histidine kinase